VVFAVVRAELTVERPSIDLTARFHRGMDQIEQLMNVGIKP